MQITNKFFSSKFKIPFNYGWIALVVGTLGTIMSIPGQTMGVSVFTDFLIESLNISRTALSTTYMIGTITSALLLGKAGKFYDKYGAKRSALIASIAMAGILLYLSYIDKITDSLSAFKFISPGITAFILLSLGFFILRFFGQGILAMVSRNMVVKWFDRNQGLIMAIMGAFVTFGFSLAPKLFNSLIEVYNWRVAWRLLAIIIGIGFTLVVLIFYKDSKSETVKKETVSEGKTDNKENIKTKSSHIGITLKEALKTRDFWSYNLAIAFFAMFNTAFTFHIVSIFSYGGIDRATAVSIFIPISIIAVICQIIGSTLSDYISLKIILLFELAGIICASIAIVYLGSELSVTFLIIGLGIANGAFVALLNLAWVKTFGKKHLGAISGYAMGWTVAGSALGPFLFSTLRDLSGDYDLVAFISMGLVVILLIFSFVKKGKVKIW